MKKLKRLIFSAFAILFVLMFGIIAVPQNLNVASAANDTADVLIQTLTDDALNFLNGFVKYNNRLAGSEGEKQAATDIAECLLNFDGLKAYGDNGLQEFAFESIFTNKYETSNNVIFDYIGDSKSSKKIVIGCHYDAVAFKSGTLQINDNITSSESVAGSAANVALLLSLAKNLPALNLNYNIEFVFFGAGESNNAGSEYYVKGMTKEQQDDLLLMVNFDNVVIGKNIYFYTEEVQDDISKSFAEVAEKNNNDVKPINTMHLSKTLLNEPNEIGLDYVHLAMISDNYSFKKQKIKTINFFAGDYEEGVVLGRSEFAGKDNVMYSENDNIENISKVYGENLIHDNYCFVFEVLTDALTLPNFIEILSGAQNQTNWFYMLFANPKLASYLVVVALFIMIVVAMFIHYKLTIKAYHTNIEKDFLNSVVKICSNVGINENSSDDVPSEVSRILADSIKKDKQIKVSRFNINKTNPQKDEKNSDKDNKSQKDNKEDK